MMQVAVNAVPEMGAIPYEELLAKLHREGNGSAVPFIAEAKRRKLLKATLKYENGVVIHTYERVR
jgi:hypothetical protein